LMSAGQPRGKSDPKKGPSHATGRAIKGPRTSHEKKKLAGSKELLQREFTHDWGILQEKP